MHPLVGRTGRKKMADIAKYLGNHRLFQHLNPEELDILASRVKQLSIPDGPVMNEGDPPDGMYMIQSGFARVTKASATGSTEAVLALLQQNDSFGEISLIDGLPRTASVIAMGPMECYYLERQAFIETLEQNPRMALSLIRSLATMVRTADDWVAHSI